MKPYNVLVVDDSAFMRKIISDLIENDADFQVTATAANGREAIQKINELNPDLVTMDVEMPEMNGLEALKIIMAERPLPVIMLSGINEEGMKETILALEWGAFDFIRKPSISNSQDITAVGESLREQMKEAMLARHQREARQTAIETAASRQADPLLLPERLIKPESQQSSKRQQPERTADRQADKPAELRKTAKLSGETGSSSARPAKEKLQPGTESAKKNNLPPVVSPKPASASEKRQSRLQPERECASPALSETDQAASGLTVPTGSERKPAVRPSAFSKLVAVGCSTGGPRALKALLENIPADFPAPVVIVQHMPPNFTKSLAQRLNTFSPLEVTEAEQGMILKPGAAYIAPGGYHMKVVSASGGQYAISLTKEEARNGHRPSVDTLFESLLPLTTLERHAVLMTGMGSDGARMMKVLYDSGVTSTFAESEETCVVYGMPRSAVELQCVRHILPLQEIAPRLVQAVK